MALSSIVVTSASPPPPPPPLLLENCCLFISEMLIRLQFACAASSMFTKCANLLHCCCRRSSYSCMAITYRKYVYENFQSRARVLLFAETSSHNSIITERFMSSYVFFISFAKLQKTKKKQPRSRQKSQRKEQTIPNEMKPPMIRRSRCTHIAETFRFELCTATTN